MAQPAEFLCVVVFLETMARSNAVMWLEHNCNRELSGISHRAYDLTKYVCFLWYLRWNMILDAKLESVYKGKVL